MNSQLYSVSKIFTEKLLRIPDYQRGYAWTDKQLKDYWSDLNQLEEEKNHYFGVLTLENVPEENINEWFEDQWIIKKKSFEPFYIVDGQQRLTTTIILIQAITEILPEGESLNYTTRDEIRQKFIFASKDGGISRSYIFGYERDNPSYEYLKTVVFKEFSENNFPAQETIYTRNLLNAKQFFISKLEQLSLEEIENIYRKVTQSFLFNVYAISEDIDTYVAFETMNNRGKPLSHLELLKNRLIYLSTKFDAENEEKNKLRRSINEGWKSIYHYLGKNKNNPLDDDLFLQNHFILYFGDEFPGDEYKRYHIVRYGLYREVYKDYLLERKFNPKRIWNTESDEPKLSINEIYKYVGDLKNSVEVWYQLLNPNDSQFSEEEVQWLDKLNKLEIYSFIPLLLIFFRKNQDTDLRVKLLRTIERLEFVSTLYSIRFSYRTENPYLDLAQKFRKNEITTEKIITTLNEAIEGIVKNPDHGKNLTKEFRKRGFYKWRGIAYFLYEYESYLKGKSKTYREKIEWEDFSKPFFSEYYELEDSRDYHTIEHIYPQTPRRKCWTEKFQAYNEKQRSALRHSLGNLIPLSKPKNSSFQNKCFEDKKDGVDNPIGFSYGSYSENEIANKSDWTAVEIMERGLALLYFMEERWNLNLGTLEDHLSLLHVEFVPDIEKINLSTLRGTFKKQKTKSK